MDALAAAAIQRVRKFRSLFIRSGTPEVSLELTHECKTPTDAKSHCDIFGSALDHMTRRGCGYG